MKVSRMLSWLVQLVVLALLHAGTAPTAGATVLYRYTGNNYDTIHSQFSVPVQFDTTMSVSGFIELSAPLSPNLVDFAITAVDVLSASFSTGRATLTETSTTQGSFQIRVDTDSTRNISDWSIILDNFFPGTPAYSSLHSSPVLDQGAFFFNGGFVYGEIHNSPGTWSLVPEPSTALLLTVSLAGLAVRARRPLRVGESR